MANLVRIDCCPIQTRSTVRQMSAVAKCTHRRETMKRILIAVLMLASYSAPAAAATESYCRFESSSIDSDRQNIEFAITRLNSKMSYINSMASQINLARSASYSTASYINTLISSYNMQIGFYNSDLRSYQFNLVMFNQRVDSYNIMCTR